VNFYTLQTAWSPGNRDFFAYLCKKIHKHNRLLGKTIIPGLSFVKRKNEPVKKRAGSKTRLVLEQPQLLVKNRQNSVE
jgi:hypothetical protein